MRPIRVVIADEHTLVREGIRQLLLREGDLEIVGEAADEAQIRKAIEKLNPNILLLDPSLLRGLEALRTIRERNPAVGILILTDASPAEEALDYLRAGAKGTISKREAGTVLARAIRIVAAGENWAGRKVITQLIDELATIAARAERPPALVANRLTTRELRIAELVTEGLSNEEIAARLRLSEKTVKNHLSNIFQKYKLRNRTQLTALMLKGRQPEK